MISTVPDSRVRACNDMPVRAEGEFVLYWMIAARRPYDNFALQRARDRALELHRPLVVLEALRVDHPHASPRLHTFVLQGMYDNLRYFAGGPATYHPYVEGQVDQGRGLVQSLCERAALVVTDDYPSFFLPQMVAALARRASVRVEAVDANGLLPMALADRTHTTAHGFRRYVHRQLLEGLPSFCERDPLDCAGLVRSPGLPDAITARWPAATEEQLEHVDDFVATLPLSGAAPAVATAGGHLAGLECLTDFLHCRLERYSQRNQPSAGAESGLSPYLHFGHVSAEAVVRALWDHVGWHPGLMNEDAVGRREGFHGTGPAAEAFLDQIVTWRELGFNMASREPDHESYDSLPAWAIKTLDEHRQDERPALYSLEAFEAADTHDEIWNAAQRQLLAEGTIHNYLRMLWGKKILHWSRTPREAAQIMITLNDRYALDGRDPNSYSGIFWILGRYDRAWGPQRPVFGKIRYMTSDSTRRKLRLGDYLQRHGPPEASRRAGGTSKGLHDSP